MGKTKEKGAKKMSFRLLKTIQQVLIVVLKKINDAYTNDDFKEDMVKHVLKYAYMRTENKPDDIDATVEATE